MRSGAFPTCRRAEMPSQEVVIVVLAWTAISMASRKDTAPNCPASSLLYALWSSGGPGTRPSPSIHS